MEYCLVGLRSYQASTLKTNYNMKYNILSVIGGVLFGSMAFVACNNADYPTLDNQAYIAQTKTDGNSSTKLTIGTTEVTQDINVTLSEPAAANSAFELVYDTLALAEYNKRNETEYVALPTTGFSLSANEVVVEAGKTSSSSVTLTVNPLTTEQKNSGARYAIPVRLKSKDGKKSVLNSGGTMMYLLEQVVIQPVPTMNSSNNIKFSMRQEYALTSWTLEMNVNMSKLGTAVGELNNQAIFGAWAPSGKDGEVYMRFGDAPIEGNRLQVKTQGTQINSNTLFDANKWYHIAAVCEGTKLSLYVNGKLDNSIDLPGKVVNLSNSWRMGNQDYLKANVMLSEVRFWTKSRSASEISNNMYSCNPKSDGLEGYWKMNEGSGTTLNDATGHGNTGSFITTPTWTQNVRIDGK